MSTFKELTYMALEELKLTSDDSYYTEDHILFLLSKYRAFLLKLRYADIKKQMPESNYQTLTLDLELFAAITTVKDMRLTVTDATLTDLVLDNEEDYLGVDTTIVLGSAIGDTIIVEFDPIEIADLDYVRTKIIDGINSSENFTATIVGNNILIEATTNFTQIPTLTSTEIDLTYTLTPISVSDITNTYIRSVDTVPYLMQLGNPRVYSLYYYTGDIAFISRDRMRYVGHNRFLLNIVYCSINPDTKLYFKSVNADFLLLDTAYLTGLFQDCIEAANFSEETPSDIMDKTFPIEEALIPPLIELVVKEISGIKYLPKDEDNNATDDTSNIQVKK